MREYKVDATMYVLAESAVQASQIATDTALSETTHRVLDTYTGCTEVINPQFMGHPLIVGLPDNRKQTATEILEKIMNVPVAEPTKMGLARYVLHGTPPGDFLTALLENDLLCALSLADSNNREHFLDLAQLLYNLPAACFGSEARVKSWIDRRGLKGGTV